MEGNCIAGVEKVRDNGGRGKCSAPTSIDPLNTLAFSFVGPAERVYPSIELRCTSIDTAHLSIESSSTLIDNPHMSKTRTHLSRD